MSQSLSHVGVVFGGPSPEHDVSILTGLQSARALEGSSRYARVSPIYWAKNGDFHLVPLGSEARDFVLGVPNGASALYLQTGLSGGLIPVRGKMARRHEPLDLDALVLCSHGGPGEDGSLQGALDLAGIAYTGPGVVGAALGMDKFATGAFLKGIGLPILERHALVEEMEGLAFPGPYIIKPRFGGSSIGIEVVADFATAKARLSTNLHLRRGAVIEPFRPEFFDLQIAVRSYPTLELSAIERPLRQSELSEILDYKDKYVGGAGMDVAPREVPARISKQLEYYLRETATTAASALGVRGVARIDFLSDGEIFVVNEINTIPGSLSRHLFVDPPVEFADLLHAMLLEAIEHPTATISTAGSDGLLLRDAKAISSKLG